MNRQAVLSWLEEVKDVNIQQIQLDEGNFEGLLENCGSELEKTVLKEIRNRNMRLPDDGQKIICDNDGNPIASVDFYYEPKMLVFVDGSPHHLDYVQVGDEEKRRKLRSLGYRIVVIKGEDIEKGLSELVRRI